MNSRRTPDMAVLSSGSDGPLLSTGAGGAADIGAILLAGDKIGIGLSCRLQLPLPALSGSARLRSAPPVLPRCRHSHRRLRAPVSGANGT